MAKDVGNGGKLLKKQDSLVIDSYWRKCVDAVTHKCL